MSADTVVPDPGSAHSHNRYGYVLNRPVCNSDPSGHCEEPAVLDLFDRATCVTFRDIDEAENYFLFIDTYLWCVEYCYTTTSEFFVNFVEQEGSEALLATYLSESLEVPDAIAGLAAAFFTASPEQASTEALKSLRRFRDDSLRFPKIQERGSLWQHYLGTRTGKTVRRDGSQGDGGNLSCCLDRHLKLMRTKSINKQNALVTVLICLLLSMVACFSIQKSAGHSSIWIEDFGYQYTYPSDYYSNGTLSKTGMTLTGEEGEIVVRFITDPTEWDITVDTCVSIPAITRYDGYQCRLNGMEAESDQYFAVGQFNSQYHVVIEGKLTVPSKKAGFEVIFVSFVNSLRPFVLTAANS